MPSEPPAAANFLPQLRALVEVESPSEDPRGCRAALEVLRGLLRARGLAGGDLVDTAERTHLHVPPPGGRCRVLLLGHIDTVWPTGTLARWPLAVEGDRVTGPGVFDMKAGLVMGIEALAALKDVADVGWLVTSDEEIGAPSSQRLIEDVGRRADAVLVLEPAAPGGGVKIARKGVGMFTVDIQGRAAHAGLDPHRGINALLALAALAPHVAALSAPAAGTTVTPTVAEAGTTRNTVPATASFTVDVRAETAAELQRVRAGLAALAGATPSGATVRVREDGWRPPLERDMTAPLLPRHRAARAAVGLPPGTEVAVGGGSDGNFTAAVGTPTLDGLGPVGDGAHAEGEHILLQATLQGVRVLSALVADLVA